MDVTLEREDTTSGIRFNAISKKKTFVRGRYTIQLAAFRGKVWLHIQGTFEKLITPQNENFSLFRSILYEVAI
jgi:hypothetical protein